MSSVCLFKKILPIFLVQIFICYASSLLSIDPDEVSTLEELVTSRGFVLQRHHVQTDDGYILSVERVVPYDFDPFTYNLYRKPVIGVHGIFLDSAIYYINTPFLFGNDSYCGDNFAFCMLLSGRYDLWVVNSRGNGQSNRHLKYNTNDPRFWKFSFDQMAEYDLPAIIDLVQTRTGHETIGYVGFSQGCSQMFALLSLYPHYARVIRPFIAWAPAVFLGHATSILATAITNLHHTLLKPGKFPLGHPMMKSYFQWHICHTKFSQEFCNKILEDLFGDARINVTRIPVYSHFLPALASNWQVAHLGQNGASHRFRRFNYPTEWENLVKYGQKYPPDYPLWNISKNIKIIIMYGATDKLVDPRDARKLISLLRKYRLDVTGYQIPAQTWGHGDFFLNPQDGQLLYDKTVRYLDLYS